MAELLTTEEIAAVRYISVDTVRTHVRNILRKLGASTAEVGLQLVSPGAGPLVELALAGQEG